MKILILFFSLASFNLSYSTDSDSTFILHPNWKLNDTKKVICLYKLNIVITEDSVYAVNIKADTEIKVINVSMDSYSISWKIMDIESDIPVGKEELFFNKMVRLISKINPPPTIIKISKDGEYKEIENLSEVTKYYDSMIDSLIEMVKREEPWEVDDNFEQRMAELKKDFLAKEMVEKQTLKSVLSFFDLYNTEFKNNLTNQYIPLEEIDDSVYITTKISIAENNKGQVHLINDLYVDESQKEKIENICNDNSLDIKTSRELEQVKNLVIRTEATFEKNTNWIIQKKSTTSSGDLTMIIEYYTE